MNYLTDTSGWTDEAKANLTTMHPAICVLIIVGMLLLVMFVVFVNNAELFHFSYQRYIENQIRAVFGLEGTPVRMVVRQKGDKE